MIKNEVVLQFQGFHPSTITKNNLAEFVSELNDEVPHGASIKATFTRKDHLIKGIFMIKSSAGHFFATASSHKIRIITHKIREQLRKQLSRWKHNKVIA